MPEKVTTRVAVGSTLLVTLLVLLGCDYGSGHGWGLGFICLLLTTWGGLEFARLVQQAGMPARTGLLVVTIAALESTRILGEELSQLRFLRDLEGPILVAFAFALLVPPLFGVPSRERLLGIAGTVLGLFYVWFTASYVTRLRYLPSIGVYAASYMLLVAKGSDIFAYLTGKLLGRTKLIPNISPGKTVAGFVGGLAGAVLITLAFSAWTPLGTAFPLRFAAPIGIILGLVAMAGDLVESLFKRSAELKDSARLIPTFGGILDVIDSILTAAPATYYLVLLSEAIRGPASGVN